MRLTAEQVGLLEGLGKTPHGHLLREYISAEIEDCNGRLRTLRGDELLREQGKAVFLDQFAKALSGPSAQRVTTLPKRPVPADTHWEPH